MPATRKNFAPLLAAAPVMALPMVVAFHVAVLGAAIAWQSLRPEGAYALVRPPRALPVPWWMAAIAVSWLLVLLPAALESRLPALRQLAADLYVAVAPVTRLRVAVFAGLAGVCEEALFRGPLQATVGWPIAAVVFAVLHGGMQRKLWVWTAFALLAGVLMGLLVHVYDALSPAIVAHITVNAINMRRLQRYAGVAAVPGP